jgi:AcrR family transcriptional regulator
MNEVADTKQKILDAAESLFAHEGYHGTSLRAITGRAGVNLAAVNYHFGSKEALLEAMFGRRLVPLNEERMTRLNGVLEAAGKEGQRPIVADVLRAFVEPTLRFKSEPGREDFMTLVGRAIADPNDIVLQVFLRFMGPVFHLIYKALREALPELPEDTLLWRLHFVLGALSHTMRICGKGMHPESIKLPCETRPEAMSEMLVHFLSAGLEAS